MKMKIYAEIPFEVEMYTPKDGVIPPDQCCKTKCPFGRSFTVGSFGCRCCANNADDYALRKDVVRCSHPEAIK